MPTFAAEEAEKLRAFEQRMQQEGVAAFAAGPAPWEHWDDIGTLGTYQVWMNSMRHSPTPEAPPRKPLANRLLTSLAQLAFLALLIGTGGVYFSIITPEQVASNGIQPPPIVIAGRVALRTVTTRQPVIRAQTDTLTETTPAFGEADSTDTAAPTPLVTITPPLQQEAETIPPGATLASTLDELPGTAAGPAAKATPGQATASLLAAEPAIMQAEEQPPATGSPQHQTAPQTTAIANVPETPTGKPAPAQDASELDNSWVVNLASYNFESMAKRKLDAFRDKGVNAELVHVTVKGKPMIRIRTTGYRTSREARDWVTLLEERLGLEGAWIAKYQPGEQQ